MPSRYTRLDKIELETIQLKDTALRQGMNNLFVSILNLNYQEYENNGNYTKYKDRYSHKATQLDEKKAKTKRSNSKEGTKIHLDPVHFNPNLKQSSNGDFDEKGLVYDQKFSKNN